MATETFTPSPASAPAVETEPSARASRNVLPARLRDLKLTPGTVLGALLLALAASIWLRTVALHFYYWIDEGLSVEIASHKLTQIPSLLRQDGSPPLYYLILHVWMSLRGHSEIATHELSLIFALLTIPVAYWAGATLFDRKAGVIAAVIAAGAPYLTTYAQETRMYALMTLLSLLIAGSFVHVFVHRRRLYRPVFSVSLAAALYTHNWAIFVALMCGVAFLWCVYEQPAERRSLWLDGLISFGLAGLLYLPWLPTMLYQSQHTGAPWAFPPVFWSLTQGMYFLVGGRGVAMLFLLGGGGGLLSLRGGGPAGTHEAGRSRLRLDGECLLILGVGTLLTAWVYAKISPAWAPRYFAAIVGPLILLFALGFSRAGRLGLLAIALTACFWLLDPVSHNLNTKSNVASVVAKIRHKLGSDPLVLSTQPEQVPTLTFYLPGVRKFGTPLSAKLVPDPGVVDWRDALGRLRRSSVHTVLAPLIATLRPGQRVVLMVPATFPKQPLWMKLIDRATARWTYFLSHDSALKRVGYSDAHWFSAGVPIKATIYERRAGV